MKVAINTCYGGFGLSKKAYEYLGEEWDGYGFYDAERTNPKLIECIEALGKEANGSCANLYVVEIPEDATDWRIEEYDGSESVWYVLNGKMLNVW